MIRIITFVIPLFFLIPTLAWSQVDTIHIFYDAQWKEILNGDSAEYRRVAYKGNDDLWHTVDYYKTGQTQMTGTFLDKEMKRNHGVFEWFYKDGSLSRKGTFEKGISVGEHYCYYENGQIDIKTIYDPKGRILKESLYKMNGEKSIRENAEFPGGNKKMNKYLKKSLKNTQITNSGVVLLSFVVSTDGSIEDIQPIKWSDFIYLHEAIAVVKAMPKWKPGTRDQVPIRLKYNLPINFRP